MSSCNSVFQEKKLAQETLVEMFKDVMNYLFTLMLEFLNGDIEENQKLTQPLMSL